MALGGAVAAVKIGHAAGPGMECTECGRQFGEREPFLHTDASVRIEDSGDERFITRLCGECFERAAVMWRSEPTWWGPDEDEDEDESPPPAVDPPPRSRPDER